MAAALLLAVPAGDELDVVGTRVLCLVTKGSTGRIVIVCFRATAKGAMPGSYFAGIGQDGRVLAGLVDAKGQPKITDERKLAAAGRTTAAAVRRKGNVGRVFRLTGTTTDCAIVRSGAGKSVPIIYCSRDGKVGPIPGTYSVIVSDQVAGVGKIEKTRVTTMIWVKNQSKG